ncbi:MAG: peptide-methionine (S)-S-oxide reductase MsrA [Myxococcota bacterium]
MTTRWPRLLALLALALLLASPLGCRSSEVAREDEGATPAQEVPRAAEHPRQEEADVESEPEPEEVAEAYFAGGCFWGVESLLEDREGVLDVTSGYMGGDVEDPTYPQVSSGETGHAETVRVRFDPSKTTYEALARRFFEIHDPTQVDRQGPDRGTQYRSAVFVADEHQREVVERLIDILERRDYDVATEVEPAGPFYPAEARHQDYYARTGKAPYCHAPVDRFGDDD